MSTSPITGQKISDISFPEGVLVGAIQKGKARAMSRAAIC